MGAELKPWTPISTWETFNPDEWRRLQTLGIEVALEEVIPADDGTLEYRGQKVVLYIRDQRIAMRYHGTPGGGYRYHVADCDTLQGMRDRGRYERYVVSVRKDGRFIVNRFQYDQLIEKELEVEIPVCKNCLRALNYNNYNTALKYEKLRIWTSFNLIEYFDKYPSKIRTIPKHTAETAPLDTYTEDWDQISRAYRESVNWKCEDCGLDMTAHPNLLHVHHRNGVESDNRRDNLEAVCIGCHVKKPDHDHLRHSPDYATFQTLFSS